MHTCHRSEMQLQLRGIGHRQPANAPHLPYKQPSPAHLPPAAQPMNAGYKSNRAKPNSRAGGSQQPRSRAPRGPPQPAGGPAAGQTVDNTRLVAVQQLLRIEEDGAFAGLVSGAVKASTESPAASHASYDDEDTLDGDDAAQSSAANSLTPLQQRTLRTLVNGVTRWRRRLDHIISSLTGKSVSSLDPNVRQVLRLALFELTHLSLAPHALGEFVSLTRKVCSHEAATRLVNAVLRRAGDLYTTNSLPRPEDELAPEPKPRDWARAVSISMSHPTWMVMKWLKRWGQEATLKLIEHNNKPPVFCLRVNGLSGTTAAALLQQLQEQGVSIRASPWLPGHSLEVTTGLQQILAQGHVTDGRCCVQDVAASLVVALALAPAPGERVLDCCAAPGGKTLFAADLMQGKGSITAMDISATRVKAIERMAGACQVPPSMLHTAAADLLQWAPQQVKEGAAGWDKVLLDAPCSGTGVLSKRADLRWRRSAEDMTQLVQLQGALLDAAALLVRPGGSLVYSTCSIEEEENMGAVLAFLERHPEFQLQPVTVPAGIPASVINSHGCLEMLPHVHGTDGAFGARLVKAQ